MENKDCTPEMAAVDNSGYARHWLWLSVTVIIADQLSKWWAETVLLPYQPVAIAPMFNFTLAYNTGAAFSFLSDAGGWQRWFFIALSSIIIVVLFVWIWQMRAQQRLHAAAIALILGGAIGNLVDRIWHGHVVDFFDVYYKTHHWPIFNIADSAISIGVALLFIELFVSHREEQAHSE